MKEEKKKSKIKETKEKGITLIALVITVVILIILATVTLNVVLGEGGLIDRAQEAKDLTEKAALEEQEGLNSLMSEYANIMAEDSTVPTPPPEDKSEVEEAKDNGTTFSTKTTIEDEVGNQIVIPAGFKVASDSGNTVQQGIVIEDVNASTDTAVQGSQYVWIPVGVFIKDDETPSEEIILGRYDFDLTDGTPELKQAAYTDDNPNNYTNEIEIESSYSELVIYRQGKDDKTNGENATAYDLEGWLDSVKENEGYYIGRYEASFASGSNIENYKAASKISTNNSTASMSYNSGNLWNYITQLNASKVSINTYSDSTSVKSDLMNSYAWDTAIVYIQEAGHTNYANQDGQSINSNLTNTGTKQDEVCKINDLASNLIEWTTEYSSDTVTSIDFSNMTVNVIERLPCTVRGGGYLYKASGYGARRANYRAAEGSTTGDSGYTTSANSASTGFRITLYMQ